VLSLIRFVSQTYASYPYNDFPQLAIHDSSLRAYMPDGLWITNATQTIDGGFLAWITTSYEPPPVNKGYTAVSHYMEKFAVLAWNGRSDLWSLCPYFGRVNVVYNAPAASPPQSGCYDVKLNIVPICEFPLPSSYHSFCFALLIDHTEGGSLSSRTTGSLYFIIIMVHCIHSASFSSDFRRT